MELPTAVLSSIRPLSQVEAQAVIRVGQTASGDPAAWHDARGSVSETSEWLRSLPVEESFVSIAWNDALGLELPWSVFCEYWSDFCYPSSDDVVIVLPPQGIARWHHYERFEYWA
jgi:hypothetical protein